MIPETCPCVSRETQAALDKYLALLEKWQAKINLVSPDTMPQVWERHFLDSLQLLTYIGCHPGEGRDPLPTGPLNNLEGVPACAGMTLLETQDRSSGLTRGSLKSDDQAPGPSPRANILLDIGTGAGFPGLVLAIARPDLSVHLVESDAKKVEFLKTVSRETATKVTIHHARIEAVAPFHVDIIAARALAPLVHLLTMAQPFVALNPGLVMIFPKGASWRDEVDHARQKYNFTLDDHPSLTSSEGRVLIIRDLWTAQ